ncbi:ABC transporter permease [Thermoactinospora rubra]|uniref:ABC transporter permease n=1 Tax=Thermoactinospora rubra TaxID=1088767 RepID=UPI000A1167B0|nr:ABC transporter permease [Thermoactinospora rubra]
MISARLLRGAAGVAGFLVAGELLIRFALPEGVEFPPPSTVLPEAGRLLVNGEFLQGVVTTMANWAAGLLLAIAVGVPAGVLLGAVPPVERALRPILEFLRPIPSVAIIPLAILLIASDSLMKITVTAYACLWPVLINTLYGMRDVDPIAKDSLRSFGFGPLAVLWRVSVPASAPFMAAGIRIASGVALILAVSAELFAGGTAGIGVFVIKAGSVLRLDLIVAATLWAGVLGLLVNLALVAVERRVFHWHRARTGEAV